MERFPNISDLLDPKFVFNLILMICQLFIHY